MTRVQVQRDWTTPCSREMARSRLLPLLQQLKLTIRTEQPAAGAALEISVDQGSQLVTRLLGGWFVAPRHLPKRGLIRLTSEVDDTLVSARFEETLGFGFLDPHFRRRYEEAFAQLLDRLQEVLPPISSHLMRA